MFARTLLSSAINRAAEMSLIRFEIDSPNAVGEPRAVLFDFVERIIIFLIILVNPVDERRQYPRFRLNSILFYNRFSIILIRSAVANIGYNFRGREQMATVICNNFYSVFFPSEFND